MFKKQQKQQETEQHGSILYQTHHLPRNDGWDKKKKKNNKLHYCDAAKLRHSNSDNHHITKIVTFQSTYYAQHH